MTAAVLIAGAVTIAAALAAVVYAFALAHVILTMRREAGHAPRQRDQS